MNNNSAAPPPADGWRTTIDGWVRDPAIRRFALVALAMLLGGAALVADLATGALAAVLNTLLPTLLVKAVADSTAGAASLAWWLITRRRARRQAQQDLTT